MGVSSAPPGYGDTVTQVVLLEGGSDVAAIEAVVRVLGRDDHGVRYVDMQGVTNVRAHLERLRFQEPETEVLGMCDASGSGFVMRALEEGGAWLQDASDLPTYGFVVCEADLEDELLRALGPDRAIAAIEGIGLAAKLTHFRQEAAWQDRPVMEQLHRFAGAGSGRKEAVDAALAAALTPEDVPEPLRMLAERIGTG